VVAKSMSGEMPQRLIDGPYQCPSTGVVGVFGPC
jgi:hypothetical protein